MTTEVAKVNNFWGYGIGDLGLHSGTLDFVPVSRRPDLAGIFESSIPMQLPEPRREAQHPLHALELIQPVLDDLRLHRVIPLHQAGGTRLTHQLTDQLPVPRQGPFAITSDLVAILGEENQHGHAIAAVDLEGGLDIGVLIAIEIPRHDFGRDSRECLEDRALGRAITAPRAREDKDVRSPRELAEELLLGIDQASLLSRALPLGPVGVGAVFRKEIGERESGLE